MSFCWSTSTSTHWLSNRCWRKPVGYKRWCRRTSVGYRRRPIRLPLWHFRAEYDPTITDRRALSGRTIGYSLYRYRRCILYRVSTLGDNEISQLRLTKEVCQSAKSKEWHTMPAQDAVDFHEKPKNFLTEAEMDRILHAAKYQIIWWVKLDPIR